MAALVTLATALEHLRLTLTAGDPREADVQLKLDQAEVIIVDYIAERADPSWAQGTAPKDVTAAILLMLTRLYEHRGDLEDADAELWLSIERLLMRRRDAAIA